MQQQEDLESIIRKSNESMDEAINHLARELSKLRAGKASPLLLSGVMVEYYGNPTPLPQVANVNTPDAKTLSIQPWEKSMIAPIEQAIFAANLGLTPQNNGEMIIINIPALTEERRKDLVKQAKVLAEDAKISLRNARHKALDFIKNEVKNGYSEDLGKRKEDEVQKMVNHHTEEIAKLLDAKETEIMTI